MLTVCVFIQKRLENRWRRHDTTHSIENSSSGKRVRGKEKEREGVVCFCVCLCSYLLCKMKLSDSQTLFSPTHTQNSAKRSDKISLLQRENVLIIFLSINTFIYFMYTLFSDNKMRVCVWQTDVQNEKEEGKDKHRQKKRIRK